MSGVLDHIAFATKNTDQSAEIFSVLGFKHAAFHRQPIEKFGSLITKLVSSSGQVIEIVEPSHQGSVVEKMLKTQSASIYHSAFYVENFAATLATLKKLGTVVVTEPMSIPYPVTPAHRDYKTCHLYHPYVGLFEITGA